MYTHEITIYRLYKDSLAPKTRTHIWIMGNG